MEYTKEFIEQIKQYYIIENHSGVETAKYFNLSLSALKNILSKEQIHKDQKLINQVRARNNILKFGYPSPASNPDVVAKMRQTKLERYGDAGYNNVEKIKATNLQKYGVANISQTFTPQQFQDRKEKMKQTYIAKYGRVDYWNDETIHQHYAEGREKAKQTCLDKYGTPLYSQSQLFQERISERTKKTQDTNLQKYGVKNVSQVAQFSSQKGKHYIYQEMSFDSSWELALWIYAVDHKQSIERCTQKFEYIVNEQIHYYFPDFIYQGKITEVKGPQFFQGDSMICPFDPSSNTHYNAKFECMKKHNVAIFGKKEMLPILEYIDKTYGKKYLLSFKQI